VVASSRIPEAAAAGGGGGGREENGARGWNASTNFASMILYQSFGMSMFAISTSKLVQVPIGKIWDSKGADFSHLPDRISAPANLHNPLRNP